MNKNEFIDRVAEMAGINKAEATRTVDSVFDAITDALRKGDDVRIVGLAPSPQPSAKSARAAIRALARPSKSLRASTRNSPPEKA